MNEGRLFLAEIRCVRYLFVQRENKNKTVTEVQISPFIYFLKHYGRQKEALKHQLYLDPKKLYSINPDDDD
jgi:hypothetical protein